MWLFYDVSEAWVSLCLHPESGRDFSREDEHKYRFRPLFKLSHESKVQIIKSTRFYYCFLFATTLQQLAKLNSDISPINSFETPHPVSPSLVRHVFFSNKIRASRVCALLYLSEQVLCASEKQSIALILLYIYYECIMFFEEM